jgi:predicted nucleic acid-binding protein
VRLVLDTGVLGASAIRESIGMSASGFASRSVSTCSSFPRSPTTSFGESSCASARTASLGRLDELTRELPYVSVSTATWRRAAALWAAARNGGLVTAPPEALDGDVLIAAQAIEEEAAIVTLNMKHFVALSVSAFEWHAVSTTGDLE